MSICRDYGPFAERRRIAGAAMSSERDAAMRVGDVGPEDFCEMFNDRKYLQQRQTKGLPTAPHAEPADAPDAEAAVEPEDAPAESDTAAGDAAPAGGAEGASGGGAAQAGVETSEAAESGEMGREDASNAATQPRPPTVQDSDSDAQAAEKARADSELTRALKELEEARVAKDEADAVYDEAEAALKRRGPGGGAKTKAKQLAVQNADVKLHMATERTEIADCKVMEAKRKVEAAAAAPAEAALADSDIGEAQTQTYRAMAPVAAAMAASAAVEATTGAPVEPSADEKHPSGMRNSRPAHTREVRAHHAHKRKTHAAHTTLSQGVCQLGYWNKPNGPIKRFLRLLVDHMIYVRDGRPLEVDPKELRETGDRVLGAAVNRVRANM